eukprot:s765_g28.t1
MNPPSQNQDLEHLLSSAGLPSSPCLPLTRVAMPAPPHLLPCRTAQQVASTTCLDDGECLPVFSSSAHSGTPRTDQQSSPVPSAPTGVAAREWTVATCRWNSLSRRSVQSPPSA